MRDLLILATGAILGLLVGAVIGRVATQPPRHRAKVMPFRPREPR